MSVGSYKCGKKRWEMREVISEIEIFSSTAAGESYKINHKINYKSHALRFVCEICVRLVINSILAKQQTAL